MNLSDAVQDKYVKTKNNQHNENESKLITQKLVDVTPLIQINKFNKDKQSLEKMN